MEKDKTRENKNSNELKEIKNPTAEDFKDEFKTIEIQKVPKQKVKVKVKVKPKVVQQPEPQLQQPKKKQTYYERNKERLKQKRMEYYRRKKNELHNKLKQYWNPEENGKHQQRKTFWFHVIDLFKPEIYYDDSFWYPPDEGDKDKIFRFRLAKPKLRIQEGGNLIRMFYADNKDLYKYHLAIYNYQKERQQFKKKYYTQTGTRKRSEEKAQEYLRKKRERYERIKANRRNRNNQ